MEGQSQIWDRVWHSKMNRQIFGGFLVFVVLFQLFRSRGLDQLQHVEVPSVSLDWKKSPYDPTKVAFLVDTRPLPLLIPLILHMTSVIPPEWRSHFMGSQEAVASVLESPAIQRQIKVGKLDVTYIPSNMTIRDQEETSRFFTTLSVYETLLQPAEHLLVYQTDSILCGNSEQSLNDWLDYDWVGAPWSTTERYGGNGGLSLRRVSAIIEILRNQVRRPQSEPEDVWLSERLAHRPGGSFANGTLSGLFSGENLRITETPMGYHFGGGGRYLLSSHWGTPELRQQVWDYCPEVKIIVDMDASEHVDVNCNGEVTDTW